MQQNPPSAEQVEEQLKRILSSPDFQSTGQLSAFLRFIVEEELAGRADRIKGYTVATEVFGRARDFDPVTDPIVRIQAMRLRRRVATYYAAAGKNDPILIEVPKGAYVPAFSWMDDSSQMHSTSGPEAVGLEAASLAGPSLAVLPFVSISQEPDSDHFAIGLAEQIVAAVTCYEAVTVIGLQSTLQFRATTQSAQEIARGLGVRFLLSGSTRISGQQLRIAIQLTDGADGVQLWADTLNRRLDAPTLVDMEDAIATKIVARIADEYGVIPAKLKSEARTKPPHDVSAYEASLLFYHYNATADPVTHGRALGALEKAIGEEPDYALGWAQLAELYTDAVQLGFDAPADAFQRAQQLARRAVALDPLCQHARTTMAYVNFVARDYSAAIHESEAAIEIHPNSPYHVMVAAFWMGLAGRLEQATRIMDKMELRNPAHPGWLHLVPLIDHLERGEYAAALVTARSFRSPGLAWDPLLRASTAVLANERQQAVTAYRELAELFPEVAEDPAAYMEKFLHFDKHREPLLTALDLVKDAASSDQN